MTRWLGRTCLVLMGLMMMWPHSVRADVSIVRDGKARAAIYVAPQVMQAQDEKAARRGSLLRDSVNDLAHYLQRMSGAPVEIISGPPPAGDKRIPILIGELAVARFGPPKTHAVGDQGFRVVVTADEIGLLGESDLATSYAIYEVLHQLGCRWYMPSEMGEVIPRMETVTLREHDLDSAPYTYARTFGYCDEDYRRHNRLGGVAFSTGHGIEEYLSDEQRRQHPEWLAVAADGTNRRNSLKYSAPGLAEAVADVILGRLEKDPTIASFTLSPADGPIDGFGFDTTDDPKLDAGDFDPVMQGISNTDRLVWFCNRVAGLVNQKYPHVTFGMLAYMNYTRPPVREKVSPNIIPDVAPLWYSRAIPWTDFGEPNNKTMLEIVRGWAKLSPRVSYFLYDFFWPELSAPFPLIKAWSVNLPIIYREGNCKFWHPDTRPNFEVTLQGAYLGSRLAWDPNQDSAAIIDEFNRKFYGHAAPQMAAYWSFIDGLWVDTPEYSERGHLHRFTRERMATARRLLNEAIAAAQTPEEKFRITMADESLQQWELFMKMQYDLAEGRFAGLADDAAQWTKRAGDLAVKYQPQHAFGYNTSAPGNSFYIGGFQRFYGKAYSEATGLATDYLILTPTLRSWRFRVDPQNEGEAAGWGAPGFDDSGWKLADSCVETLSALGYHNYRGAMWYRAKVKLPPIPAGKKVYMWIGGCYAEATPIINGKRLESLDMGSSPRSLEITDAVAPDAENQIVIRCVRSSGRMGLGGLFAPVVIYQDK